ncbi:MAG: hypothetical protein HZA60_05015 [Deltaproteobacteria bacterium]|nr:hypothetical protein [Deltaproteobacteria bacterium]
MTKCAKFEDILARYVHGGVLLQEKDALEKHLSVCVSCEKLYRGITDIDRLLRQMPEKLMDPPPYLRAKILAHLPELGMAPLWRRWGRWAAALGAVAVCALLAVVLYLGSAPREPRLASAPPLVRPAGPVPAPASAAPGPKAAEETPAPPVKAAPAAPAPGTAVAAAPKVQIIREVKIYFYYPPATRVAVTGDFNGWNPEGVPLKAAGKPGLWKTTLRLKPGAYSYNFIVDDNILVPDPNAPDQMPDGYGGTNSILLVKGGNSV